MDEMLWRCSLNNSWMWLIVRAAGKWRWFKEITVDGACYHERNISWSWGQYCSIRRSSSRLAYVYHWITALITTRAAPHSIGVGAQSTLWGHDIFCPKNIYEKLTRCPNFTRFLPEKVAKYPKFYEKLSKFPNFTWFSPEKCQNFP